jgi:uncharacterized protein (DUF2141 family)
MGSPDGGWYDDTPPSVIGSTPEDKGVNVKTKKVTINFDEFIKIEDAQNKVIVSPPQLEMADIKAAGRKIIVSLKDSLKENTTYTIDFSDAISDNNEGNPMGNYTFSFSTGDHIDTLEVSGYCLNAENLEPVKGMLVGLYDEFEDSLFHTTPMMRVSRTNGSGRFTIKGVAPGNYRCFALQDGDADFVFGQKSEAIAFNHDTIKPTWKPDIRQDTIWLDSLHIADIKQVGFTHFLPDDITLLCFQEPQTDRYLIKSERKDIDRLEMFFSYGSDSLPVMRGLNFDSENAFILEASEKNDTLVYWLADTTLVNQDTLQIERTYLVTDTLGALVQFTDTTEFVAKTSYAKRQKEKQKEMDDWLKEQEKKKKRGERYDSIMEVQHMSVKWLPQGQMDPEQQLYFESPVPLSLCDTAAFHITTMIDSVDTSVPFQIHQVSVRRYWVEADWQQGASYKITVDSAAMQTIYGMCSDKIQQTLKVRQEEDFAYLAIEISGAPPSSFLLPPSSNPPLSSVIVQLLDTQDKPVRQSMADESGVAEFRYLKAGKYYLRAFIDYNGNGKWDTGIYDQDLMPEPIYYNSEAIECKEKWEATRQWNLTAVPRYRQKPMAITKQKPEKEKQLRNRNLERARSLGIEYINSIKP